MLNAVSENDSYCKFWKLIKMMLVLSHRQATIEQGFSINKQVETDNLCEETVVAKRTLWEYVNYLGNAECRLQQQKTDSGSCCCCCSSEVYCVLEPVVGK
jgi:vacuolar-type H+-ATPase catalytic subunit A/Vma1